MPNHASFDSFSDFFSFIAKNNQVGLARRTLRELMQETRTYSERYLALLPLVDYEISRLYFLEGLSQDQISVLMGLTQAAVSRRLKYIEARIKFYLKMPSLNPIQVRTDFIALFPPEWQQPAYFFYWELAQNRVKFFIRASQSGSANKFNRVLRFLEAKSAITDEAIAAFETEAERDHEMQERYLSSVYLDFFRYTRDKSNVPTFLFKKNDKVRADSLYQGISIYASNAPEVLNAAA